MYLAYFLDFFRRITRNKIGVARSKICLSGMHSDAQAIIRQLERRLFSGNEFRTKLTVLDMGDLGIKVRRATAALPHTGGDISSLDEIIIFTEQDGSDVIVLEIVWKSALNTSLLLILIWTLLILSAWPLYAGIYAILVGSFALLFGITYLQVQFVRGKVIDVISDFADPSLPAATHE